LGKALARGLEEQGVRGMWNIIIGIVFIVGGLPGKLVLRGTNSSPALMVVGGILVIWGLVQMGKRKGNG